MATLFTCQEALERILAESDGSESDFESSDSEDDSVDNNRVYGFPNDRGGNAFAIVREQESFENDEADAEGSDFSEEHEIIDAEEAPEIAFVDERNSDILVGRHNVVMAANGAAAVPEQQATRQRQTARQRRNARQRDGEARPELNLRWEKGNVRNSIPNFSQRSGPVRVLGGTFTPLSFFQFFWSDDLFDFIRVQTNKNAVVKRNANPDKHKCPWEAINDVAEIKAFFGLCLAMGILKLPLVEMYWQRKFSLFEVNDWGDIMSRNRFTAIMRYLKFCDKDVDKPAVEPGQPGYDRLYKVRRFLSIILPKYESEWISSQWLAINEQMIPYRGRVGFRQFIANKPSRFGIKVWAMADATTGYILKQQIYTGKKLGEANNRDDVPYVGLAQQVVTDLLQGYDNKGYVVVTDNFYSSPSLSIKLKEKEIDSLGTVKATSKGFPEGSYFPVQAKTWAGDW